MQRPDSFEKTLILGKIEGRKRRTHWCNKRHSTVCTVLSELASRNAWLRQWGQGWASHLFLRWRGRVGLAGLHERGCRWSSWSPAPGAPRHPVCFLRSGKRAGVEAWDTAWQSPSCFLSQKDPSLFQTFVSMLDDKKHQSS